jgi:hypothetical protein
MTDLGCSLHRFLDGGLTFSTPTILASSAKAWPSTLLTDRLGRSPARALDGRPTSSAEGPLLALHASDEVLAASRVSASWAIA